MRQDIYHSSKGALFPHQFGAETPGNVMAKKMTTVDKIKPVSSPAAVR